MKVCCFYEITNDLVLSDFIINIVESFYFFYKLLFIFQVVIPWCSPVSFRALFYTNPFKPDLELSPVDVSIS